MSRGASRDGGVTRVRGSLPGPDNGSTDRNWQAQDGRTTPKLSPKLFL